MPTVPRYGQLRVTPGALPGAYKQAAETPESLGAGLARAQGQTFGVIAGAAGAVSQEAQRVIGEQRQRADEISALKWANSLDEWETRVLIGTEDDPGAYGTRGQAAFALPQSVLEDFDHTSSEIERSLGTDAQREAFAVFRDKRRIQVSQGVHRHVQQQITAAEGSELKARIEGAQRRAAANATDPVIIKDSLTEIVNGLLKSGPRLGLGPQELEEAIVSHASTLHVGVISGLRANGLDTQARAYFAANKQDIAADRRQALSDTLGADADLGAAQAAVRGLQETGGTLKERRQRLKDTLQDQPKVLQTALQLLEHEEVLERQAKQQAEEASAAQLYNRIDSGKLSMAGLLKAFNDGELSGPERASAKAYWERLQEGPVRRTDAVRWKDINDVAGLNPTAFMARNLFLDRAYLSESDYTRFAELQRQYRSGPKGAEDAVKLVELSSRASVLNAILAAAGLAGPDHAAEAAEIELELSRRVMALQKGAPDSVAGQVGPVERNLSNEEIVKISAGMIGEIVITPGSWWSIFPGGADSADITKPLRSLKISDVPPEERKKVEAYLRTNGIAVTEDSILLVWIETAERAGRIRRGKK